MPDPNEKDNVPKSPEETKELEKGPEELERKEAPNSTAGFLD